MAVTPWDSDALWAKAKLFISRAMDGKVNQSFDIQALWAAVALESLGKAALASHSPLLVAAPNEEGTNLLAATGLVGEATKFTSISAKTMHIRCGRAFRTYNRDKAKAITDWRNDYLHGVAVLPAIPESVWWADFWSQAEVLIHASGHTVDEFVGPNRSAEVQGHLAANARMLENRLASLVDAAKRYKSLSDQGQLTGSPARRWREFQLDGNFKYWEVTECPACKGGGVIFGDEVISHEMQNIYFGPDDDVVEIGVSVQVAAELFECEYCHLRLDDYDLLVEADLSGDFEAEGDIEDFIVEEEYGND